MATKGDYTPGDGVSHQVQDLNKIGWGTIFNSIQKKCWLSSIFSLVFPDILQLAGKKRGEARFSYILKEC